MVYGFVTQSGGQVKIDSMPGAGTTVTLYLPAHDGDLPRIAVRQKSPDEPRPEVKTTILLVDDEESIREPLTEYLTEFGFDVIQAANGTQGLEILKSHQPVDLLVSDVGLPGSMNGRQLADAGRALRPQLKVMFITGYADKAVSEGGLPGIGMEIMIKPFGLADFLRKVGAITGVAPTGDTLCDTTV